MSKQTKRYGTKIRRFVGTLKPRGFIILEWKDNLRVKLQDGDTEIKINPPRLEKR